jgi:outer membrane protein assembly factor BamB/predicted nucleic acid-binding Zn ribbon protein
MDPESEKEKTENEEPVEEESKDEKYLICPVCNKANPAGTRFCQYCWGAALHQDEAMTAEETATTLVRREQHTKRWKRIRFGIIGVIAAVIIGFVLFVFINYTDFLSVPTAGLNSNSPPGEWAMFRHDTLRTGSAGDASVIPAGTLKWSFQTGAAVRSSPAVADGTVYFGSQDYSFYALDAGTGEEEWRFETGSRVNSSPAVAGGRVYFGSNDSNLYVLDAGNGEEIWTFDTAYPIRSSPAIADGTVYFGSDDYFLYALDSETGVKKWAFDTGSPAFVSPVIDGGILYYGSAGGYSYTLNAKNGQRRLAFGTTYAVYASAVVNDGTVYFATTNGILNAVEGTARTWLWEHDIRPVWVQAWAMISWLPAPPPRSGFLWAINLGQANSTTPVIDGNTMYIGSGDYIIAIDLTTHQKIWAFETGGVVRSSPAKTGPVVYAGSDDGNMYALDASSGELRWKYQTGGEVSSSPAVVDGVVYFGSDDGNLYAVE